MAYALFCVSPSLWQILGVATSSIGVAITAAPASRLFSAAVPGNWAIAFTAQRGQSTI